MDALRFAVVVFGNPLGAIAMGLLLWGLDLVIGLPIFASLLIAAFVGAVVAVILKRRGA